MQSEGLPGCHSTIRDRARVFLFSPVPPHFLPVSVSADSIAIVPSPPSGRSCEANKLATVRWGLTKEKMQTALAISKKKDRWNYLLLRLNTNKFNKRKAMKLQMPNLTGYTSDFAGATMHAGAEMADEFWKMFARGF